MSYPYGSGEQFLANEIEFLSKRGMDIVIYPSARVGKVRDLPNGVKVVKFKNSTPWHKLILNVFCLCRKKDSYNI